MKATHYMAELKRPAPCDDCWYHNKCKTELLACRAFVFYVNNGRVVYDARDPNKELWQKLFVDDEDLEVAA